MSAPACCLCGQPCEPSPTQPGRYGHNPEPLGVEGDRCCATCNNTYVLAARIHAGR